MIDLFLNICLFVLSLSILFSFIRLIKGPTTMDRLLCMDGTVVSVVSIMVILSMKWGSSYYMDLILLFSIFGFIGTVVFCYFLEETGEVSTDPEGGDYD